MGAVSGPRNLLQLKEQELSKLREDALAELEEKLSRNVEEYKALHDKFEQLHADFEYNLKLLAERDEELGQFEHSTAVQAAMVLDRDRQLAELQATYDEAYAALKLERTAREEDMAHMAAQYRQLQQQLEDVRTSHAQEVMKLTEQHEQTKRVLQRSLADTEEALSRQQREMDAAFATQAQNLELKHRQALEEAQQATAVAKALADRRESEAKAAHAREQEQLAATQAALAATQRHEQNAKALSFELDSMRKLKDDAITELTAQNQHLKHQLKIWSEAADAERADLAAQLASVQQELEDVTAAAAAAASVTAAQHEQEVAMLRQRLEQTQASVNDLGQEVQNLRASIKAATREQQDRIVELEKKLHQEREEAAEKLSAAERQHGAELRETRETLWARDEEVRVLREKVAELRQTLNERRSDIQTFRDQLVEAGERERELHRRVVAAELRVEDLTLTRELTHDSHNDQQLKALIEQRDAANLALQDAQSRLLDKEVECMHLADALAAVMSPRKVSSVIQSATRIAATARTLPTAQNPNPKAPGPDTNATARDKEPAATDTASVPVGGRIATTVAGGFGASRPTRVSPLRPPRLAVLTDSHLEAQASQESLMMMQAVVLPSPLPETQLPSPQSSYATTRQWEGLQQGSSPTREQHVATAAARAAQYLHESKDELDELLRPVGGDRSGLDVSRRNAPWHTDGDQQQAAALSPQHHNYSEATQLRHALQLADTQNTMLRHTLAVMRQEMEALQTAAATAAKAAANNASEISMMDRTAVGPPGNSIQLNNQQDGANSTGLLVAELQASDRELQQALQHIRVLQQQLSHMQTQPLHGNRNVNRPPNTSPTAHDTAVVVGNMQPALHAMALTTADTNQQQPYDDIVQPAEVSYLRQRVESLVLECRLLRRQALQLRMAPAPNNLITSQAQHISTMSPEQDSAVTLNAPTQQKQHQHSHQSQAEVNIPLGPTGTVANTSDATYHHPGNRQAEDSTQQTNMAQVQGPSQSTEQHSSQSADAQAGEGPGNDVEEIMDQLEDAQQLAERLQQENEQLMDISNALRAERDKLAAWLASMSGPKLPANSLVTVPLYPPAVPQTTVMPPPPSPYPLATNVHIHPTSPQAVSPALYPQPPWQHQTYTINTPYMQQSLHDTAQNFVPSGHYGEAAGSPGMGLRRSQSAGAMDAQHIVRNVTPIRSRARSPPPSLPHSPHSPGAYSTLNASPTHSWSPGRYQAPLRSWAADTVARLAFNNGFGVNWIQGTSMPIEEHPPRAVDPSAQTLLQAPASQSLPTKPSADAVDAVPRTGQGQSNTARSTQVHPAKPVAKQSSRQTSQAGSSNRQPSGAGSGSERPQIATENRNQNCASEGAPMLPGAISARETPSQRAKLKALQKKSEQTQAQLVAASEAAVLKVRNWNVRDDDAM